MTFDKKWRFPPKIILSRIQFSTEKHDRLSLTDDSCHSQCATDEATKQENSMFSNGTKRTGSIAPDTMLISVFDLTTAVFPAREVQLTWRAAGCFSTPSHLLLSLRKLSRGKPPHAAAGWILIPVLWICIGKKKKRGRTDGNRLICLRRYRQKMWQSRKSHFFQPLYRGVLFAAEKLIKTKHINQDISGFGKWKQTCSNTHTIWSRRQGRRECFALHIFWFSWGTSQKAKLKETAGSKELQRKPDHLTGLRVMPMMVKKQRQEI